MQVTDANEIEMKLLKVIYLEKAFKKNKDKTGQNTNNLVFVKTAFMLAPLIKPQKIKNKFKAEKYTV